MLDKGAPTKERILLATVKLIREVENVDDISVRRIAKQAGVSFGTINYHFQTKDNLIRQSIVSSVNRAINKWTKLSESLDIDPRIKLRILLKNSGDYYAKHPNTLRTSIYNTYFGTQWNSNLYYFIDHALMPLLHIIYPDKSDYTISRKLEISFLSFPFIFLQYLSYPERTTFNFFIKEERDSYIDEFIDTLLLAFDDLADPTPPAT